MLLPDSASGASSTSFSVRDILDFNASIMADEGTAALMEPMVAMVTDEDATSASASAHGYYGGYWMEEEAPVDHLPPTGTGIPYAGYSDAAYGGVDYAYGYGLAAPSAPLVSVEDFGAKEVVKRSTPLTSHHVQQLSHLCPPFPDDVDDAATGDRNNKEDAKMAASKHSRESNISRMRRSERCCWFPFN